MAERSLRTALAAAAVLAAVLAALPPPAKAQETSSTPGAVVGVVKDPTGAVMNGVAVSLLSPLGATTAALRTDAAGTFRFSSVPVGSYVLLAESEGFAPRRVAVRVEAGRPVVEGLEVALQPEAFQDEVTVTASPGRAEALEQVPQRVNVIGEEDIVLRAKAVVAQAANDEVGLHFQRTSSTMGGFFVRGLTGTKVNVYVDGIRYTTSAQRGGVSTFFNMVDPAALEGIEVLRGPSSAEYGSDALGGSVQFLTRSPSFASSGERFSGAFATHFGSADTGYGSSLSARYAGTSFGLSGTLAGRRGNTVRPGEGIDSHNSVTRYFGLSSTTVIDERLPDTAFTQYGGQLKAHWSLGATAHLTAAYMRDQQDGGKRYDQLLGGDGNLQADLRNLMTDLFYVRFEKSQAGFFDRFVASYSFNTQREERRNQGGNGNPRATVNHEPERTTANGLQVGLQKIFGRHDLNLGGDYFFEGMDAPSFGTNPTTGATTPRRGRVPDGATYHHGGIFLQEVFEAVPRKLRLNAAVRFSTAHYEARAADSVIVNGQPLWPDDDYDRSAFTFRVGALWTVSPSFSLAANVSRGYRAPDITDLGTFGLTGAGYEISNREVEGLGATVGTTADANAVSTGDAVAILDPEESLSYELTLRYKTTRFKADLTVFQNDIENNIAKQTVILPQGAVGLTLAGEPIVRQLATGAVFVAVSPNPVLVRASFDRARIRGLEATFDAELTKSLFLGGLFTYLHAEDRDTELPPNIEGGTPAPDGWIHLRWAPNGGRRYWIEPYVHLALEQDRLSTLDLGDRRIGAGRSRTSIAAFFNNGARARGWVSAGPDGVTGNADDVLTLTGETLAQVQERVLGPSGASSSLFTAIPSYAVFGVRGAVRFGARHEVLFDLENLGDENYRGISWGMDAPGRGIYLRYAFRF